MKKSGCLNSELSYVIAKLGHFDTLTIADCGLPIPKDVQRIDLAVTHGIPTFKDVFDVVTKEAKFQKAYIAKEAIELNTEFLREIEFWAKKNDIELEFVSHDELKALSQKSAAVVRTGECRPYANIILESGVSF